MNTIPKIELINAPTPLEYLAGVSEDLGVNFYIKRDDLTGLGTGGNKLRKLEYLLADARAHADLYIQTDSLTVKQVRDKVIAFIEAKEAGKSA